VLDKFDQTKSTEVANVIESGELHAMTESWQSRQLPTSHVNFITTVQSFIDIYYTFL